MTEFVQVMPTATAETEDLAIENGMEVRPNATEDEAKNLPKSLGLTKSNENCSSPRISSLEAELQRCSGQFSKSEVGDVGNNTLQVHPDEVSSAKAVFLDSSANWNSRPELERCKSGNTWTDIKGSTPPSESEKQVAEICEVVEESEEGFTNTMQTVSKPLMDSLRESVMERQNDSVKVFTCEPAVAAMEERESICNTVTRGADLRPSNHSDSSTSSSAGSSADSEADSLSSSDTESGDNEASPNALRNKAKSRTIHGIELPGDGDEDDEQNGPMRTRHERDIDSIVIPPIEFAITSEHKLLPVGVIKSVMEKLIIVESLSNVFHSSIPNSNIALSARDTITNAKALDSDTLLCLLEPKTPLGRIFETFGPVTKPFYAIRFNSADEIKAFGPAAAVGKTVAFIPEVSTVVRAGDIKDRGYDASNLHDEEVPRERLDYSDDEAEARARRVKKRGSASDCNRFSQNGGEHSRSRPNPSEYGQGHPNSRQNHARQPRRGGHQTGRPLRAHSSFSPPDDRALHNSNNSHLTYWPGNIADGSHHPYIQNQFAHLTTPPHLPCPQPPVFPNFHHMMSQQQLHYPVPPMSNRYIGPFHNAGMHINGPIDTHPGFGTQPAAYPAPQPPRPSHPFQVGMAVGCLPGGSQNHQNLTRYEVPPSTFESRFGDLGNSSGSHALAGNPPDPASLERLDNFGYSSTVSNGRGILRRSSTSMQNGSSSNIEYRDSRT